MATQPSFDLSKLTTSWTKFDIVQVLDILFDKETLISYVNQDSKLNTAILKSFLGVDSLDDEIPDYWFEILKYPNEKRLFGLFALILTHHKVLNIFRDSAVSPMIGEFNVEEGKMYTNIRSCLVESGASKPIFRRKEKVPYDFTTILLNKNVGNIFRNVIIERLNRISTFKIDYTNYISLIDELKLYETFSCDRDYFLSWLESYEATKVNVKKDFPYIKNVQIQNFYSIVDPIHLDFGSSKEIYFVGENGDGKSLILMALYLAFNKDFVLEQTDQERTGKIREILKDNPSLILSGMDSNGEDRYLKNIFAYGTHRGRSTNDNFEQYGFMSLFDSNEMLISPEKWLKDQLFLELQNEKGIYASIDMVKDIIFDILEKNVRVVFEGTDLYFFEKGRRLKFEQLSEGYKSVTVFVIDLLYRLQKLVTTNEDIFKIPAVVIVDEIDLHLHPKWKKVIVRKLRDIFKNIQFIFTTHSPSIIQGASEDSVIFKVYRNQEDGITRVTDTYFRKDLNYMMLNTLVTSSLFGLESARLDSKNDTADTSDSYLLHRINLKLDERLALQRKEGKKFISDEEIDDLINLIMNEELDRNDKTE
ncbi:hypothetical protein SF1_13740 [Sphingobacterium faecium NBRC 15299]|uniref:AAA family ATPase n=1 Tax=Sphingobacterium faecium TaxID=34087 RepID=UPI000D47E8E8|nr:AAA family ATPase [Sphingobacterium faecium]PTX11833.1 putative AbiEii toxin of type IV toxin-antitoxin system [Sphingobacterium faecium]GEM63392.1 hypothetical protein SF1_13740 [Sphingobacterium faecium NBRC 15299]